MVKKKSDPPEPQTEPQVRKPAPVESPALGLTERRRGVRKLPVPEVLESNRDSDWAAFGETPNDNKNA